MSSAADFPVRTFPMPGFARALMALDPDCGPNTAELFASYDHGVWSSKTSQGSLFADSIAFSGTWPHFGITRNGFAFERVMSALRTTGDGSSSWLTPTPTPSSSINNGSEAGKPSTGKSLQRQASGEWSEHWPTPNRQDANSAARHTTETGVMHPGTSLTDAVRDWVTPTCRDKESLAKVTRGASATAGGTPLLLQVMYPTPARRDYRWPNRTTYQERGGGSKGEQLNNFVAHLDADQIGSETSSQSGDQLPMFDTAASGSDGPPDRVPINRHGNRRASSVVLSPAWVSILMGFPPDWCDIGDVRLPRSAMRSSRKLRKSLDTSSSPDCATEQEG